MRFLGIDYGARWVGVALSDESGQLAFPHSVLANSPKVVEEIQKLCLEENVAALVVGESKNYQQKENEIMGEIRAFAQVLGEKIKLPVHFEPEFMTTREAKRTQEDFKKANASAAALILQSYLDKINKKPL